MPTAKNDTMAPIFFLSRTPPVALNSRPPTLPTRGGESATSGEAIGVPDDAVGRRGDGRIASGPPGLPRRDSDGVRAPDKRRGGGAAAG